MKVPLYRPILKVFHSRVEASLPLYHKILTSLYRGDNLWKRLEELEHLDKIVSIPDPDARIEACVTKTLPDLEKKTNIDMDDQQDVANLTECLLCYALAFWLRPDSVSKLKGVGPLLKRERERLEELNEPDEESKRVDWV